MNYSLKPGEKRKCFVFFNPGEVPVNTTITLKATSVDTSKNIFEQEDSLDIVLKYEKFIEKPSNKAVQFSYLIYDFGVIPEGIMVTLSFEFINASQDSVYVLGVESSCGCLVAYFDSTRIGKGNVGKIDMEFYSDNKLGFSQKTAVVQLSNGETVVLSVTGEVQPPRLYDSYR